VPYTPTTRRPTGNAAAPLIMVSGLSKSGKSLTSYSIGMSDRIANTYVCDLGEGSADEYGDLGCYEVLEWGRTFADLTDTIRWAVDQPVPDGKLNAVIIDSGTDLWDTLKIRADRRARSSKRNAQLLRDDPDHEVDVSMPYWNDAKEAWARVISPLRLAGHVVGIVLVRTEVVAEVVNGAPTNRKITSYQCEKTLPAAATAHVSIGMDHAARLIEVRSMRLSVPSAGLVLDQPNPLGHLLDLLAPADTAQFAAPAVMSPIDEERLCSQEQRQMLVDLVLSVTEGELRDAVKHRLLTQYGRTTEITRDRFDEVMVWLCGLTDAVMGRNVDPAPDTAPPAPEVPAVPQQPATDTGQAPTALPADDPDAPPPPPRRKSTRLADAVAEVTA
jgi:hypothetical protein